MDLEWLREVVPQHRFKIVGGLAGLIFALLVVRFGFWWALFILLCTGIGYWVGKRLDEEPDGIMQLLERLIPPLGR